MNKHLILLTILILAMVVFYGDTPPLLYPSAKSNYKSKIKYNEAKHLLSGNFDHPSCRVSR